MIDRAHDRVQTTLRPGLERIGTLTPRSAREIGPSRLAIGCEMLPRGYGDFEAIKEYLPPLGLARVRLHAGWAKLEPKPGVWDFSWLDRQVDWLIANDLEPILETSYGNPAYTGAGGASLSDGMPRGEEALAAWDRYVDRIAERYPQVKNWACWNEPNNTGANTAAIIADNNVRTARAIRRRIPDAKVAALLVGWPNVTLTAAYLKELKARNAVGLFHWIVYHDYSPNPDNCYARGVDEWVRLVRREAPSLRVWNGESGATSQAHYSAPISSGDWNSELTQCKWNARRLVADLGHDIESLVFTMCDPCYDEPERYSNYGRKIPGYWVRTRTDRFMKWMGLVKCDDTLRVTKVKPAYYTVQNVATLFDAATETAKLGVKNVGDTLNDATALYGFRHAKTGIPLVAFWDASDVPSNENAVREVRLQVPKKVGFKEPVWVDLVTGAIYAVPKSRRSPARHAPDAETWTLPMYDAPAVLTERARVMSQTGC